MTSRKDLQALLSRVPDDKLDQAAVLLDSLNPDALHEIPEPPLPPGRGSTGEDLAAVQAPHRAARERRALDFDPNLSRTPLPLVRDRELLEGQVAFEGTRIPVWVLFNYLSDERALAAFRAAYPQLSVEMVIAVLDEACLKLTGQTSDGDKLGPAPRRRRAS